MKRKIFCFLLALIMILSFAACGKQSAKGAGADGDTPTTTVTTEATTTSTTLDTTTTTADTEDTTAGDTTTTATEENTTAPATTTDIWRPGPGPGDKPPAPTTTTTAPTTTGTTKTTAICRIKAVPIAVASPLADIGIAEIALYDPQQFQMEEAVSVKTLSDAAEVAAVGQRLSAATWAYYPTQDKWVKFYPYFAEWALVLTCTDGRQRVLHLFSAEAGWASLGTFDGGLTYADIIAQAKAHSGDGSADFKRYKIDGETLAYLLGLFDA